MKQEVSQINFEFLNIKNRAETLRLLSEKQKDLKEYLEGVQLGLEMESINKKRLDVLNNILDESIK
jgi:histidinol phosphatase-like PHP family hydrolase